MKKVKKTIYLLCDKLSWKTFKMLQDRLVQDSGSTPLHLDKLLWKMMKDKKIYCWFDEAKTGNMQLGIKLPKNCTINIIQNKKKIMKKDKLYEER